MDNSEFQGKICPYCRTEFKEDDEIVVCSECDMPHHKECWIENQGCTTFGCLGTIQSPMQNTPFQWNIIYCTNCGHQNSLIGSFCIACGSKLFIPFQATPNTYSQQPTPVWQQPNLYPQQQIPYIQQTIPYSQPPPSFAQQPIFNAQQANPYLHQPNPYSQQPNVNFQSVNIIEAALIQNNVDYYIPKFNNMRTKASKASWNCASFFLTYYWFFYRKMYLLGSAMLAATILLALLGSWCIIFIIGLSIFLGIMGNHFYLKHVTKAIEKTNIFPENQRDQYIIKTGGTNIALPLIIFTGIIILLILVSR